MTLVQVFYISKATQPYDSVAVPVILAQSRRNNRRDDVTGCLMFSGCYFAQVLEGRHDAVERSLTRIRSDLRHTDLRVLRRRPTVLRAYEDWEMGYLHDLNLEDELEALLLDEQPDADRVEQVMQRMAPDPVMGALR